MERFPRVLVDLAALAQNLEVIRAAAPGCEIMAVIKANAYGHGMVAVARALEKADALAVARISEAIALREAGISGEIVLLEGVFSSEELVLAAQHRLTLVLHNEQQIDWLEAFRGGTRFRCWLKIDTGMHRLGISMQDSASAMRRVRGCPAISQPPGLMTHLASAEIEGDPLTKKQLEDFSLLCEAWPGEVSSANSAAVFLRPLARRGWIRPGLALYGVSPLPEVTGADLGLRPAMRFETRIISIKTLSAGDAVGYNSTWTATAPTRIGIAAVGYGDGYLRGFANGAPALVANEQAQLVGRVSMDMIALDLGPGSEAGIGDPVLLWGPELPVEKIAPWASTIPYELLCNVSARVHTEYLPAPVAMA
ncbi:MAG: alanine racemase [Gammaproteobacteria bacterium]|nr:alanine racemase [Gammaproteobacteria bacterium]